MQVAVYMWDNNMAITNKCFCPYFHGKGEEQWTCCES